MGHTHDHEQQAAPAVDGPAPDAAPSPSVDQPHGNAAAAEQVGAPPPADGGTLGKVAGERNPADPPSFEAALAFADQAHAWAGEIIAENKDRPVDRSDPHSRANVLRNTTQWIADGQASLRLLTPTHDSHLREGISKKKVATFDRAAAWPKGPGTYRSADDGTDDRTGISVESRSAEGGMDAKGTDLTVILPGSKRGLEETLIHEVQHDADQHEGNEHDHFAEDHDKPPDDEIDPWVAGTWVYAKWRSEFRSYWLNQDKGFGKATEPAYPRLVKATYEGRSALATTQFENRRAADIFEYMRSTCGKKARDQGEWIDANHDWRGPYAMIFHYYAFDPAFKAVVDATEAPVGGNLINSVRIQALSNALAHGDFEAVLTAARRLDAADRAFLANREESAPFWTQVARSSRSFDDIDALAAIIESPDAGSAAAEHLRGSLATTVVAGAATKPTTHTVAKGDTLGKIALKYLGDADRWPEIHDLNRDRVKDPHVLRKGTVLRLPTG